MTGQKGMTPINTTKTRVTECGANRISGKTGLCLWRGAKGPGGEADHQNKESHENKHCFISPTEQQSRQPGLPFHPY